MSDLLYINTDSSETVKKIMEADIPIPADRLIKRGVKRENGIKSVQHTVKKS